MDVPHDYIQEDDSLAGKAGSYWLDSSQGPEHGALPHEGMEADVVVVGAGIVGVLTAWMLAEKGRHVALLDSRWVLGDVTGHTTAKLSAQHGGCYAGIADKFGEDGARAYAAANQAGVDKVFELASAMGIDCDLSREDYWLYTREDEDALKKEAEAAADAGMPAEMADVALPFETKAVMRVSNQARFHPLKFLRPFVQALPEKGAWIHEHTRALDIDEDDRLTVRTDKGAIHARDVVIASNFPFWDKGAFFSRLYPQRTYALGLYLEAPPPKGLVYSSDEPEFAIRTQPTKRGEMTIVSGFSHKAGQGGDERTHYRELEARCRDWLGPLEVAYHWSTQDNHTPDGVPYIGRSPGSDHVWLACGFGGWGMSNGVMSAMLLTDLITGAENDWADVFDPSRVKPVASAKTFVKESANTAKELVGGLSRHAERPEDVGPDQAEVMREKDGKAAVYRDPAGALHEVSPVCTHMGCTVGWNDAEKTWDCPCHGSRYDMDGHVIHGPALRDLAPVAVESGKK